MRRRPYSVEAESQETLPFRVRLVESAQDLGKAVEIRSSAYARHVPSVGQALLDPEADDHRSDVLLLIAERKTDKCVLGSIRLQPNLGQPLRIEGETKLPASYQGRRLIEFMRLGVQNGGSGRMVMAALAKASYEICHACKFDFILVAGRSPVSDMYRAMRFDDVLDGQTIPLSYAAGLPHGIYSLPVAEADQRWRESGHGLYSFMARTEHPDIAITYSRVYSAFGCA